MSLREYLSWSAYREARGPLNPMLRNEAALAIIALQLNRANGGNAELADFMPWAKDEHEGDIEQVAFLLKGVSASGK